MSKFILVCLAILHPHYWSFGVKLTNLYAIFVSPLFDLQDLVNFADDNFCVLWNGNLGLLIIDLETRLEMIIKWLKESGWS